MGIKEKELEKLVLNLLDESSAIQDKIQRICNVDQQSCKKVQDYQSTSTQLQTENHSLKSSLEQCEELNKSLKEKLKKATNEIEDYKKRLNFLVSENEQNQRREHVLTTELDKANDTIEMLKMQFSKPVSLLENYKALSASVRTGLSDIICDKNEILFIASCTTPEHLKAIWIYTRKLTVSNGSDTEIKVLKDIFDYFFDVFNCSLREPMYVRDNVETGYSFDDDKYDRCTGSSTSGTIKEIIMRGYKSVNTGAFICRSLVRV